MKNRLRTLFSDGQSDESPSHLLSQELEFELSKSILTFAFAFIGGAVTLKTALGIDRPIEEGFIQALAMAGLSAVLALGAQQGIIKDLRLKRVASPIRRQFRSAPPSLASGFALGFALKYFEFAPEYFG